MSDQEQSKGGQSSGLTSRLPLKLLTPLALVLPVVLVVGMIGGVAYVQGRAAATSMEKRGVAQVHGRIADRLKVLLDGPVRWNALVRSQIASGTLAVDDPRSWKDPVYSQRHAFDRALAGVCWGDEAGRAAWIFRYPGNPYWELGIKDGETGGVLHEIPMDPSGVLQTDAVRQSDYDPRPRPWYILGKTAGPQGAWGEPYSWKITNSGGGALALGLPFAVAVRDAQGAVRGVLDTEVSLADLSAFLGRLKIGKTGLAFIIDRGGRLIATSNGAALADDQLKRIKALGSADPEMRAMAHRLSAAMPGGLDSFPGQWEGTVELQRGRAMMNVTGFRHERGLDWLVLTAVPLADFTGDLDAIRGRAIKIALGGLGLTLLLGMVLAAWLVRPILRLAAHAREVGAGDLEATLKLNQASELVELSREFNGMTAGLRDRLKLRKSLVHASEVQQGLLPNRDPKVRGFDIVGFCNYCDETGGDYYDFLGDGEAEGDGLAVVIGDVMGHGIASAMLMATARGVLRSHSRSGVGIAELLTHLNQLLVEVTGGMKFMTMLIANFDPKTRSMQWASAGHDAPIIYEPQTDTFREPEGGGLPLGIMQEEVYELGPTELLVPGTVVLVATDGMWETRNVQDQMHGKDRLQDSIRRHAAKPAAQIRDGLLEDLHAFRGEGPQDDDETFVVIKVTS